MTWMRILDLMIVETLRDAFGWMKDEADRLGATTTSY